MTEKSLKKIRNEVLIIFFLWLFKLATICIQVCSLHKCDKQANHKWWIFCRKSNLHFTIHPQP